MMPQKRLQTTRNRQNIHYKDVTIMERLQTVKLKK